MNPDPALALLLFMLLCGLLLVGPFVPAWREWQRPTDRQALRPVPERAPQIRSTRVVVLDRNACFRDIEAPAIVFGHHRPTGLATDRDRAPLHDHPLTPQAPPEHARRWGADGWRIEGDCAVLGHRHWRGSMVVTGVLTIGVGALVEGDIKAREGIVIGEHAVVTGSVVSDNGIRMFSDGTVAGPVLSESLLQLGGGVRLGSREAPTSVTARVMLVDDGVVVHGSVQATQVGLVRGATAWA